MNSEEFRHFGKAAIDYIAEYIDNIRDRPVLPSVKPGYLRKLLPDEAPVKGEHWTEILSDIERVIMPGMTHWQSPSFNAYYPTGTSYPSIIGEMLSAALGCIGFSWLASPACTELEVIVLDWLGKLIGLPKEFLSSSEGPGGGVIQGSASEATLVALLVAKKKKLTLNPNVENKLVAYTSEESNSSVEKAGMIASVKMRLLPVDKLGRLRGVSLAKAIESDKKRGLIPFCVVATLGTTGTCSLDCLHEIGPICTKENLWLHIDAAYAGSAAVCEEYKYLMNNVEHGDSFNINPHKWLLVNFDCSALWLKNREDLINAFNVDRIYLSAKNKDDKNAPNFRHWQIPLGRRFRSLKLWMTLRTYGSEGLKDHIRKQCSLAVHFESLVAKDDRFEIPIKARMGLVGFRLKGDDDLTQKLLDTLISEKVLYLVATTFRGKLIIRYVICSRLSEPQDVDMAWREISSRANILLSRIGCQSA